MATKTYKFYGTARWAKIQPDQLDLNYDKKSKSWKIDLVMTPGSLELYKQSGLQLKLREDKEGTYTSFRRPERKIFKDEVREMDPPYVVTPDEVAITTRIGNGSRVAVEVDVYDSMNGKGHTMKGVTVHELVPYEDSAKVLEEEVPW